jgi:hypothetical protein
VVRIFNLYVPTGRLVLLGGEIVAICASFWLAVLADLCGGVLPGAAGGINAGCHSRESLPGAREKMSSVWC